MRVIDGRENSYGPEVIWLGLGLMGRILVAAELVNPRGFPQKLFWEVGLKHIGAPTTGGSPRDPCWGSRF